MIIIRNIITKKIIFLLFLFVTLVSCRSEKKETAQNKLSVQKGSIQIAQDYITNNKLEGIYDKTFPIKIFTPRARSEDVVAFPLKVQNDSMKQYKDLIEIGIIFDFDISTKEFRDIKIYPDIEGCKYIAEINDDNNFTGMTLIRDYNEINLMGRRRPRRRILSQKMEEGSDLEKYNDKLTQFKWENVLCTGIPANLEDYKIEIYREGKRVDLKTASNVYVIYEEYQIKSSGLRFTAGELQEIEKVKMPIFRLVAYTKLAKENYIDLIGFAKNKMFKIHAWQIPGATEAEYDVALEVAKIALETLNSN